MARIIRKPSGLQKPLTSFMGDTSGVGMVELALSLPVVLLLLLGTIDVSLLVAAKLDLEQAAQRTTDMALSARPQSTDVTYLVDEAVSASGVPRESVNISIYLECDGTRRNDFNGGCASGQERARYVDVKISSKFEPVVNWGAFASAMGFGERSGPITVVGDSVVRFQ